jgi:hypothetical protein
MTISGNGYTVTYERLPWKGNGFGNKYLVRRWFSGLYCETEAIDLEEAMRVAQSWAHA